MAESVVITGMGAVCPIGVGLEEVWSSVASRTSGVRRIDDLAEAGWHAPYGGTVVGFDAKAFVKPRKSLKVMADEIQWAFAAGEQAWEHAGLEEADVDPERMGVVCGAGLMYCDMTELEKPYHTSLGDDRRFDFSKWGAAGMRELFPLWMLKYLPNMSACHIGIRRDARGPTNTIAHADASALLALGEAADTIRRGDADVMITGGSSRRLHMTEPMWTESAPFWQTGEDPATACRPFDASRRGPVCGEGSAMMVLESRSHALRRGARPVAEVLSVASRSERSLDRGGFTGDSIRAAIAAAVDAAGLNAGGIGCVNAHGMASLVEDPLEATAIHAALGDVAVTAPKSYFGNLGAAGGAVELLVGLLALERGLIPATINHEKTDPSCPVTVVTETTPTGAPAFVSVNYNATGQAVAAVLAAPPAEE
ncbi:MAG: beta-ketoacyl synthase N-terminal-like domain-containing protein [Planctomycetota bacterium]